MGGAAIDPHVDQEEPLRHPRRGGSTARRASVKDRFWNEHNFVFRRSDGLFYHGKGATPAWAGFAADSSGLTLIPLNMAEPVLIARGLDAAHGLGFAPHGAGRNMSRAAYLRRHAGKTDEQMVAEQTAGIDARFYCGIPDVSELPGAYKTRGHRARPDRALWLGRGGRRDLAPRLDHGGGLATRRAMAQRESRAAGPDGRRHARRTDRARQMTSATSSTPTDKVIGRNSGGIAEIVFNNPARLNATSLEMWIRVGELVTDYAKDPSVRVLILSGAGGKAFVSGADISKFETERAGADANAVYSKKSAVAYEGIYHFPKPTIAKVHGYCIGGGMNLAACCDLRVASVGSKFGVPAGKLGLGYGFTPVQRLADIVGISRAMQFLYTAEQIGAEEALSIGLLNKLVPEAELDGSVAQLAATIAGNAPLTVALVKASAREITKVTGERDHARLKAMADACMESADYKEGRTAFMEKRKPRFQGK